MIRPARFGDIPRIFALGTEMHERSRHRDEFTPDPKISKSLAMQAIQRHGQEQAGGSCCFVAETNGTVEGFIIGALQSAYHVGDMLWAHDLFWYASERAGPGQAIALFDAFEAWAKANPKVTRIRPSATDAVGPYSRAEMLYRRRGFRQCGVIYEKEITR